MPFNTRCVSATGTVSLSDTDSGQGIGVDDSVGNAVVGGVVGGVVGIVGVVTFVLLPDIVPFVIVPFVIVQLIGLVIVPFVRLVVK